MNVEKVKKTLRKYEVYLLIFLGVTATLIMFTNAVGRYVFKKTLVWAEEGVRIMFVWGMFIAITDMFISNEHIGFNNLISKYKVTQQLSKILYNFILAMVGIILGYYGGRYCLMTGDVTLAGSNLPTSILMLPGVVAGFVWFGLGSTRLFLLCRNLIMNKKNNKVVE